MGRYSFRSSRREDRSKHFSRFFQVLVAGKNYPFLYGLRGQRCVVNSGFIYVLAWVVFEVLAVSCDFSRERTFGILASHSRWVVVVDLII